MLCKTGGIIYLVNISLSDIGINNCKLKAGCFYSEHNHETAERKYKIRHMPIVLHHKPQDKSGRNAKIYK